MKVELEKNNDTIYLDFNREQKKYINTLVFEERFTNLKRDLWSLNKKADLLKQIRNITNECLSNGAYSEKNMEEQYSKLENVNCPMWEKEIIMKAIVFKKKFAHKTLKELEDFINKYEDLLYE